jgi:uncharacterized SAM-binding protein YcdF (DUF218 family)
MPLVWVVILLLFSLFSKNSKKKKWFLITSVFFLLFFSNAFVLDEIMRKWEIPAVDNKDLGHYDVAIVLGGMISYDPTIDRISFQRSSERFLMAIDLYKKGYVKKILLSGGSGSLEYPDMKEAMILQRYIKELGIPEEDIWVENESRNTRENALYTATLLKEKNSHGKYLLVTSAIHMRRAKACFEKEDIHCDTYSVNRNSGPRKFYPDHLLIPNVGTLATWDGLIHEWVGFGMYKAAGYL